MYLFLVYPLICSGSFSCFSYAVLFSLASIHSRVAGKQLSEFISNLYFCVGRSFVYYVACMYFLCSHVLYALLLYMQVLNDESGGERGWRGLGLANDYDV